MLYQVSWLCYAISQVQCEVLKGDDCETPAGDEKPHGFCVLHQVTSHKQKPALFPCSHPPSLINVNQTWPDYSNSHRASYSEINVKAFCFLAHQITRLSRPCQRSNNHDRALSVLYRLRGQLKWHLYYWVIPPPRRYHLPSIFISWLIFRESKDQTGQTWGQERPVLGECMSLIKWGEECPYKPFRHKRSKLNSCASPREGKALTNHLASKPESHFHCLD